VINEATDQLSHLDDDASLEAIVAAWAACGDVIVVPTT
jgi:hypothetical protein